MSKQNLFILSTPSQAFFLSKAPEILKNAVVIMTVTNKSIASKILKHLKEFELDYTAIVYMAENQDRLKLPKILFFRFWLFQFKRKFKSFKGVYIGSYSNLYHLNMVGEYENTSKIYLLYDGMQIISVAHNRKNSDPQLRTLPGSFKKMGFKQPKIKSLNFIGPFSLEVHPRDTFKTFKHENCKQPKLEENKVIFVGMPLVQLGIVSMDFYFMCLQKLKLRFPTKTFSYVPHPRETRDSILKIAEVMEIRHFKAIFEEEYLQSDSFPGTVVSFYSSVLANMIYLRANTHIYTIAIPEQKFLRKEFYKNYQVTHGFLKDLRVSGINIIELPEESAN